MGPDCKIHKQKKLKKKRTEFKLCMYCWIHESLQKRLFPSTLFDQLDLSPCPGENFYPSGFQDTLLLGDCTENWIPSPENFDIRNATFSIYKNHDTGKTGIWITPCNVH